MQMFHQKVKFLTRIYFPLFYSKYYCYKYHTRDHYFILRLRAIDTYLNKKYKGW